MPRRYGPFPLPRAVRCKGPLDHLLIASRPRNDVQCYAPRNDVQRYAGNDVQCYAGNDVQRYAGNDVRHFTMAFGLVPARKCQMTWALK